MTALERIADWLLSTPFRSFSMLRQQPETGRSRGNRISAICGQVLTGSFCHMAGIS